MPLLLSPLSHGDSEAMPSLPTPQPLRGTHLSWQPGQNLESKKPGCAIRWG